MSDEGPWLIPLAIQKPLSLNDPASMSKGARMKRAKQVRAIREDTWWCLKVRRWPKMKRIRVTLIWEPPELNSRGRRMNPRRDPLNLVATLKAVQDGIVDAGLVPDDTVQFMESPMPIIDTPWVGHDVGRFAVLIERLA